MAQFKVLLSWIKVLANIVKRICQNQQVTVWTMLQIFGFDNSIVFLVTYKGKNCFSSEPANIVVNSEHWEKSKVHLSGKKVFHVPMFHSYWSRSWQNWQKQEFNNGHSTILFQTYMVRPANSESSGQPLWAMYDNMINYDNLESGQLIPSQGVSPPTACFQRRDIPSSS